MKQLQKLQFQPGINREGTNYSAEGFWWDCNRVRFRNGLPETVGGWVKSTTNTFLGVCRKLLNWQTLNGADMLGMGTSSKLYIENGDGFYDITPLRASFTENNPIRTGAPGTSIITVTTSTGHGASVGDYVVIGNAGDVDGIVSTYLNTEFTVLSTPLTTSFTVDVGALCSAGGVTGGGVGVTIDFQIAPGADAASVGSGWGVGPWSRGAWSSEALVPYSSSASLRLWALANYGEDLLASPRNGGIYLWDATNGLSDRAVNLTSLGGATGVPVEVGSMLVTQERHIIAFGATELISGDFDPLLIRWCDQEDIVDWTPTTSNTAGDFRLTSGSYILAATASRDEILVWTDASLHTMRYSGPPYIFDIRSISENVTLASPNAAVTVNNVTYWMGHDKFYLYNGVAQTVPCSVRRHVFSNFNIAQRMQAHAAAHPEFTEVWWFYCSASSTQCDKYVVFNYGENIWYYGDMARSACAEASIRQRLLATEGGVLYVQEFGTDDGSQDPPTSLGSFIESSDFDIQDGTSFYFVERIIPDIRFDGSATTSPSVAMTLSARDFPGQAQQNTSGGLVVRSVTVPVEQYTNEVWVRLRGRHLSFKVATDDAGEAWQIGAPRIGVRTDGRR